MSFRIGDKVRMTKQGIQNYIDINNCWWREMPNGKTYSTNITATIIRYGGDNRYVFKLPDGELIWVRQTQNWEVVETVPKQSLVERKIKYLYKKSSLKWVQKWSN